MAEALRLADVLECRVNGPRPAMDREFAMQEAAAELRRLHAEVERLTERCDFMLGATREAQSLCSMYVERMQKAEAELERMRNG
jgi:hypothetical protein